MESSPCTPLTSLFSPHDSTAMSSPRASVAHSRAATAALLLTTAYLFGVALAGRAVLWAFVNVDRLKKEVQTWASSVPDLGGQHLRPSAGTIALRKAFASDSDTLPSLRRCSSRRCTSSVLRSRGERFSGRSSTSAVIASSIENGKHCFVSHGLHIG